MTEEEKIQKAAEEGYTIPERHKDVEIYRLLFKALKEDPEIPSLPSSFAEQTADKLMQQSSSSKVSREYGWKALTIMLFLALTVLALLKFDAATLVFNSLAAIKWYVIITTSLLVVIDYLDRKYIRRTI